MINASALKTLTLKDYFKRLAEEAHTSQPVKSYLELLGQGKSNEGILEHKAIKRFYVSPIDSRFDRIYLNYTNMDEVDSIVWFFQTPNVLKLADFKELFGSFSTHNVIYDETSTFEFKATGFRGLAVTTDSKYWLDKKDDKLFYEEGNSEYEVTDDFSFNSLCFVFY